MNKILIWIIIFFTAAVIFAQEELPVTQNVQIEILTPELKISSKAQNIKVRINVDAAPAGQSLELRLDQVKGILLPVKASRNEETLWLIKSQDPNDNNLVLAWETADESKLRLSPGNWNAPYVLNMEIQISFTNLKDVPNLAGTRLDAAVVNGGSENLAATTGRGNTISLKNTRE